MSAADAHRRAIDLAGQETLVTMFLAQAERYANDAFLHAHAPEGDGWITTTWAAARDKALRLAAALHDLGVKPDDRVGLVSENRPEWLIAELAIQAAGAIAVPAYTTYTEDDYAYQFGDSGAVAVIVSTPELAARVLPAASNTGACRHVVTIEDVPRRQALSVDVHRWDDLIGDHAPAEPHTGRRSDTAVIIYTSGTGGAPKGVMLSHGAILSNCEGAQNLFTSARLDLEVFLSFLPLSHSYEHMAGQFLPISIGAEIYYAAGLDSLAQDIADVRPTIMTAVPRLYEAFQARIMGAIRRARPVQRKLFERTLAIGRKRLDAPETLTLGDRLVDPLLSLLVCRKVAARFGGRLRFMVSGGAPLNHDVGTFFLALGVKILQGYGQTETAPVVSCNPPNRIRVETVGPPLRDVDVRIAGDGEICVKGELVMQGYWHNEEATKEAIRDGWLHTGDVGEIDDDGYLRITDRKKDIIVNSGGDNLSPQRVEGFLTLEPEISQAMVYGDKRPHLVAVIVPDEAQAKAWAKKNGHENADLAALTEDKAFHEHVTKAVDRVNARLTAIERVRRFILVAAPFTVDNGQMTPTLKIRRHVLRQAYGARLERLYRG